jgi:hypothetical protein
MAMLCGGSQWRMDIPSCALSFPPLSDEQFLIIHYGDHQPTAT